MNDEYIIRNIDSFNKKELKSFLLEKCRENMESKDIISFIKKQSSITATNIIKMCAKFVDGEDKTECIYSLDKTLFKEVKDDE